jgi:hypothetical protein
VSFSDALDSMGAVLMRMCRLGLYGFCEWMSVYSCAGHVRVPGGGAKKGCGEEMLMVDD